jgi:hypothetical protein
MFSDQRRIIKCFLNMLILGRVKGLKTSPMSLHYMRFGEEKDFLLYGDNFGTVHPFTIGSNFTGLPASEKEGPEAAGIL